MPDPAEIPEVGNDLSGILGLITQLFGSEVNTGTGSSSPEALAGLQQLFPLLLQQFQSGEYSPEAASRDAQGEVDMILRRAAEFGLPTVAQGENASGGYNSTTSALLRNDISSRAAGEAAARLASVKNQYAGIQNNRAMQLIAAINAFTNANRQQSTTQKNPGLAGNPNVQKAALLAALLKALTSGKKDKNQSPNKNRNSQSKPPQDKGTGNSGKGSDADSLNDMAERMGYGQGPETTSGRITEEDSSTFSARAGIDAEAVQNRIDTPSDPNYDPWDLQGNLGGGDLGGEYNESAGLDLGGGDPFAELDPIETADLGDLGDFGDLFGDGGNFGDGGEYNESGGGLDMGGSDSDFDFSYLDNSDFVGDMGDFGFDDYDFSFGFGED